MLDFNIRAEDEELFVDAYGIDNLLDLFLQEIDLILETQRSSILSKRHFGADVESYLWKTQVNASQIETEIRQQIEQYSDTSKNFDYDISVDIAAGTNRDIGIIDVTIKDKISQLQLAKQQYVLR